jgi:beta-xylosidase
MIEAVMIWNEPNNKSHWDTEIDTDGSKYAELGHLAGAAIAEAKPGLPRVLGGMSPIDPLFVAALEVQGAMDYVDVIALHGFPLDWDLWPIDAWPAKIEEMREVARGKPIWTSEVGVSSLGSEQVQAWGWTRPQPCPAAARPASSGIRCSICRANGGPARATAARRAAATTAIAKWA